MASNALQTPPRVAHVSHLGQKLFKTYVRQLNKTPENKISDSEANLIVDYFMNIYFSKYGINFDSVCDKYFISFDTFAV